MVSDPDPRLRLDAHPNSPIESLWANRPQLVPLLLPSPPARILQADTVCNLILVSRHRPPTRPHILFLPIMREVVYADGWLPCLDVFS